MKFGPILIFCGFVYTIPVMCLQSDHVYASELDSQHLEGSHNIVKKTVADLCPYKLDDSDNLEEPSRLSLPTIESLRAGEAPQELYAEPESFLPMDIKPPMMPRALPLLWSPYGMDYINDPSSDTYEGVPYQVSHFLFGNPVPPVRSLPTVDFSTQIHETVSDLETNYDSDDVDLENALYLPPNVRAVRSRDEGFLDQLKHDAMIPNIIPTIPVPFERDAGSAPYQTPGQLYQAPLMALYPGRASDCALPFLLSCSPKVVYGSLAQNAYGHYASAPEYREHNAVKNHHHVNQVLTHLSKIE